MAYEQRAVRGPDYAQLMMQSFGAMRQFQGLGQERAQAAKTAEIENLARTANVDPKAMAALAALDPARANAMGTQKANEDKRIKQEWSSLAAEIEGQPVERQLVALNNRIDKVRDRGGNPENSINLYNQLTDWKTPGVQEDAQAYITKVRETGEAEGFLTPKKVTKVDKGTSIQQHLANRKIFPGDVNYIPEYEKLLEKKSPVTNIKNIVPGQKQESAFGKRRGTIQANRLDEMENDAIDAQDTIDGLEAMSEIEVETGGLEKEKQWFAKILTGLNIDASGLANVAGGDAYKSMKSRLGLKAMKNIKGAASDRDVDLALSTYPKIENEKEANRFISDYAIGAALKKIEMANFHGKWANKNNNLNGAGKAWRKETAKVPMISKGMTSNKGLPVFFWKFKDGMEKSNPTWEDVDIIEAWNKLDDIALKEKDLLNIKSKQRKVLESIDRRAQGRVRGRVR